MKKSILIVLYYYLPYVSGLTGYARDLAENLVKQGHRVTVLATRHDKTLPEKEVINGVNVVRVPVLLKVSKGVFAPTFWLQVISMARKSDVVNFHLPLADVGLSSLFIKREKIISTYHCDLNLGKGILNKIIEKLSFFLMNIVLKKSGKIVANSIDYFAHSYFKKYVYKAIQIYPPINRINFGPTDYSALLKKLSLDDDSYKIGFVGRIVAEKGINYLLQAIPFMRDKIEHFQIVIAGEYGRVAGGSVIDDLTACAGKHSDKVIFAGFLKKNQLLEFYSMIDVLVLPSIDPLESFGMVQVESLLCGTPVIATNLPGVRVVINQTGFGYLIEPKNSEDLATKLIEMKENPPEIDCRKLEQFSLETSISQYEMVFDRPERFICIPEATENIKSVPKTRLREPDNSSTQ
jgi:glycosyltransferase involved in cell wall biosynthesis